MPITMPKEINCLNFKGLFAFLESLYGYWGINTVVDDLVDNPKYLINDLADPSKIIPIRNVHLVDQNYWVSNEFSLRLLHNVKKIVKAPNPLQFAGRGAVRESLSKNALFAGKLFGPVFLAKKAAKINARFNRTKQVVFDRITSKGLAFQFHYYPKFRVTRDVCNWNLGIYTELLHSSGVKEIQAEEVKCVLNGDEHCEFRLNWKKSGIFSRILRDASIWQVKKQVIDIIEEYEASLRERDRLIDDITCSESKYRSLFENTATANAIVEFDYTISLVNSEFEQLVGLSRSEIEGRLKCSDMFGASEFNRLKTFLFTDKTTGGDFSNNLELQFFSKEGFKKNVLCKIGHIPNTEKSILSMLDVTEMRRAEEEKSKLKSKLARSEKMEALGLLAGGVAHDLNNVLSGIVSYPDLLLIDLPEDSPFRKPIKTIQDSGTKAAAIVQDLLTLSRRDVVVKEVVNINDVIQDYMQSPEYEKMLSFHPGVSVHFIGDKELFNIDGVPLNLNKVIMNLVTNAAEATKDGGRIMIRTENCYLYKKIPGFDKFQEGNYVIVSVSDSGIGIDKKDMERIFEPFYSKKVMGRSGTGLGMTVVWGTVHDHNGHIEVNSTLGKGTTFKMLFPATAKALQKNEPSISIDDLMGKGESILVVDDVKEQRDLASSILSRLRYKVQMASSGEEAVALVKKGKDFDLVILDMLMHPGMDGLETYRELLRIKSTQHAIIASGFSETNRVKEAQNLGAGRYVRKPYTLNSIGFAVKDEIKIYKKSIRCFQ